MVHKTTVVLCEVKEQLRRLVESVLVERRKMIVVNTGFFIYLFTYDLFNDLS